MDLKEFYNENIKDSEYHYKFYESINSSVKIYNNFNFEEEIKIYHMKFLMMKKRLLNLKNYVNLR